MKTVCFATRLLAFMTTCATSIASAGTFQQPSLSGTSPSGLSWAAVATGTALPVTGTSAAAGSPGAVVYYDSDTGDLQFDPKGLRITTFILTYGTGTANVSGTTPGVFLIGDRTFPETTGDWNPFPPTGTSGPLPAVFPPFPPTMQVAARLSFVHTPPLPSSGLAIGGGPDRASTTGFWDMPWRFPLGTAFPGLTLSNFYTVGQTTNPNINQLGFGNGRATFQYSADGVVGNQVGAVIPVVPEPSAYAILGATSLVIGMIARRRRRISRRAPDVDFKSRTARGMRAASSAAER